MSREIERLRAIAASDYSVDRTLTAGEAQALLSRLDTLEADKKWWTAVNKELLPYQARALAAEAQVEALEAGLKWRLSPDWLDWAEAAEAQVTILAEALDRIANKATGVGAMFEEMRDIAREALSRVSRSEPAPPNVDEPLEWMNHPEHYGYSAPPVPEEQQ